MQNIDDSCETAVRKSRAVDLLIVRRLFLLCY